MASDPDNLFAELLAAHNKNIEALTQANQIAISGLQAVATRQMEFVQRAMAEAAQLARQGTPSPNLSESIARQAEIARQAFDASIANMREVADTLQKSGREAVDVVNQRIAQSLLELQNRVSPPKPPKG
jgi:phasin family protein